MKRMIAIGFVLVIAAVPIAGLLALAGREPAPILTAYHKALGFSMTGDMARIDDDPCVQFEVGGSGADAYLIAGSVLEQVCIGRPPAEVMHGVWFLGFEENGFIPNVTQVPLHRVIGRNSHNPEFHSELYIDDDEALRRLRIRPEQVRPETVAIAMTFVGRRLRPYRMPSGRLFQTIVVDAVLSGRVLGPVTSCVEPPGREGVCAESR